MPRLTREQWTDIRAEREAGCSFPELAEKHGVSHQAIQKRAKKEGWSGGEDVAEVVRRKVAEKVAGVVATESPLKRAAAMDAEAEKIAEIKRRHRAEWEEIELFRRAALKVMKDAHEGSGEWKNAKLAADTAAANLRTLEIKQQGESRAWALDVRGGDEIVITNPRSRA